VRADNVAFLVINKGKDFIEERLAVEAEEFIDGHTDLSCEGFLQKF
jgi:hypothetical protein